MGINFNCKVTGDPVKMDAEKRKQFEERIKDDYVIHLYVSASSRTHIRWQCSITHLRSTHSLLCSMVVMRVGVCRAKLS